MKTFIFFVLAAFFFQYLSNINLPAKDLSPKIPREKSFSGEVVGITDGDTIKVMYQGKAQKIRLAGIDCPERKQAFGTKAKKFASEKAFKKKVTVEVTGTDRYGRIIGVIILPNGQNLNHELVKAGLAWHYKRYSKDQTLADLEEKAREAKRGLWLHSKPIPPWDFRKTKRKK